MPQQIYSDNNGLIRFEVLFPVDAKNKEEFLNQYLMMELMGDLPFKEMSLEESNFYRESKTSDIMSSFESYEDKLYWKFTLMSLSENKESNRNGLYRVIEPKKNITMYMIVSWLYLKSRFSHLDKYIV